MTIKSLAYQVTPEASTPAGEVGSNVKFRQVLTAAASYIDVPNLSILTEGAYEYDLMIVNATVSTDVLLFVNEDYTTSGYYAEGMIVYGSTFTCTNTVNRPMICGLDINTTLYVSGSVFMGGDGKVRALSQAFRDYSNAHIGLYGFKKTAAVTDVTKLRFAFNAASTFGIGTSLTVRKKNVG